MIYTMYILVLYKEIYNVGRIYTIYKLVSYKEIYFISYVKGQHKIWCSSSAIGLVLDKVLVLVL